MLKPEQLQADFYVLGWDDPTPYDVESVETLEGLAEMNRIQAENGQPQRLDYGDEMNLIAKKLGIPFDDSQGHLPYLERIDNGQ
jgi:hypothetical protein